MRSRNQIRGARVKSSGEALMAEVLRGVHLLMGEKEERITKHLMSSFVLSEGFMTQGSADPTHSSPQPLLRPSPSKSRWFVQSETQGAQYHRN
mmetsp:Transcript_38183/g.59587  ORF Transcript_38183/g.59587 Transcript_38183/m.59587 type:complete len:93 (+) Transcript_38183:621-899(+)